VIGGDHAIAGALPAVLHSSTPESPVHPCLDLRTLGDLYLPQGWPAIWLSDAAGRQQGRVFKTDSATASSLIVVIGSPGPRLAIPVVSRSALKPAALAGGTPGYRPPPVEGKPA